MDQDPSEYGIPRTSSLAIASLAVGLSCCAPVSGLVSIPLGIVALRRIKARPYVLLGRGYAQAGIVLGALSLAGWLVFTGWIVERYLAAKAVAEVFVQALVEGDLDEARSLLHPSAAAGEGIDEELASVSRTLASKGAFRGLSWGSRVSVDNGDVRAELLAELSGETVPIRVELATTGEGLRVLSLELYPEPDEDEE